MNKKVFAITCCIFLVLIRTFAQEDKSSKLQKLGFMIADWNVVETSSSQESDTTNSIIEWVHDGQFVKEEVKHLTKYGPINMITYIGWDSRLQGYKLVAMDKEYGQMDVYEGVWDNEQLVFNNLNSDRPIVMQDGRELNFKLTYYAISNDSYKHKVEGTYDQGDTWFTFSISQYHKILH